MPAWIDMRDEMRALISGDARTVAQGYWIVLRIMRLGQYSQHWNPDRQEAVGGPKWLYDDFVIRCIGYPGTALSKRPKMTNTDSIIADTGMDETETKIFAIEYNPAFPREPYPGEDLIFEIAQHEGVEAPPPPLTAVSRYRVLRVIPNYGDNGRIETTYLLGQRIMGES